MITSIKSKILIVDDQVLNTNIFSRILQGFGHETAIASTGKKALELMAASSYDLILLDLMMPGMDGFEVLEEIRKGQSMTELPVIIVSALNELHDIKRGFESMANDFIIKPIDPEMLHIRVQHQLHLRQLIEERERSNVLIQRLIRIASHDLKSPLHNISMVNNLLTDLVAEEGEAIDLIRLSQTSVSAMHEMITEFLDMSIIHEDRMSVEFEAVNIMYIIGEILLEYRITAEQKDIVIKTDITQEHVWADHRRLRQVLANLVSNAIKYSPHGETITIVGTHDDEQFTIHIRDHGQGIPAEERSMLFKAFSEISTRPTAGEQSTGLGLWVAAQMMQIMGGEIGFNAPESGGSDFWIRLPLLTDEQHLLADIC